MASLHRNSIDAAFDDSHNIMQEILMAAHGQRRMPETACAKQDPQRKSVCSAMVNEKM